MPNPDILMIMADQHPPQMTGCYRDPVAVTPNLDALAKAGVTLDAAYTSSPLCAPARAAMMTGRHVHNIEVWDNAAPLRCDWPTFAHSFSAAGYRTVLCGKMHFVGPDQHHGFLERWTRDIYPADFSWTITNRERLFVKPKNTGQSDHRVHKSGIGESYDMPYDENVFNLTRDGIKEIGRLRQDGTDTRPFFLCASFAGPHYPYYAPQKWWDLYGDADIPMPDLPHGHQHTDHAVTEWLRRFFWLQEPVPEHVCRRARHAQYGRTSLIDHYVGELLNALRESGLHDNTCVVYTSDHGDMMGEHGLWFKCSHYEWSSRVPLIVSGPGIVSDSRCPEPASLLDVGPTLCGLAGIEPASTESDGRDVSAMLRGQREPGPGRAMVEYYGDGTHRGWRMLRRGDWKLLVCPGTSPQLFNLRDDPGEWNDRAADPDCATVLDEMTATVMAGWDPANCDERRYQSEERRMSILRVKDAADLPDWQIQRFPGEPQRPRDLGIRRSLGGGSMRTAKSAEHNVVYHSPGRFAGWPANYGMWSWGDEIVLMFTVGYFSNEPRGHKRDKTKPFETVQARSVDGGLTWTTEPFEAPTPKRRGISADEHMSPGLRIGDPYSGENPPRPLEGEIDFAAPQTSVLVARTTYHGEPGNVHSWFYVSDHRCRSWRGPFEFVGLGRDLELASRTDIVPLSPNRALFLLTANKSDRREGRVCCAETRDGGRSFSFLSWLGDREPPGYEIMPSTVRFPDGRIVSAVRSQKEGRGEILLYESVDEGVSWSAMDPAVPNRGETHSNPPAMVLSSGGRLAVVYGYRNKPYGMRGKVSVSFPGI